MVEYPSVYEGNEPYIFISYAHKNSDMVLPIVSGLQDRGFRVWYDAGIETGTEWPEYIADHLASCGCAIIMVTEAALESHNCRREIHYAISQKVPMLVVYLEDVKMSRGMEMQLGVLQALFRSRHGSFDSFMDKLCSSALLEPCKASSCAEKAVVSSGNLSSATSVLEGIKLPPYRLAAIGTFCTILAVMGYVAIGLQSDLLFLYMQILVVLGAVMLGPGVGAALGMELGIFSVWYTLERSALGALLWPLATDGDWWISAKSLLGCFGCAVLLGVAAGWLWRLAKKIGMPELLTLPLVSGLAVMLRALVVGSANLILALDYAQGLEVETEIIVQTVLASGIKEAVAAALLVTVLYKLLQLLNRRLMKKKGL